MTKGFVHSFESFGSVDGPGVRFIVFLQGCKMRCCYCHNPDSWKIKGGTAYTAEEVLQRALRFKSYWGKDGGITVSGGEPLLQLDFLLEFFKLCKAEKIHTAIDTAAGPFTRSEPFLCRFRELMDYTDLLIIDIKEMDPVKHKHLTKVSNENILDCILFTNEIQKPVWIRHVLIPEITDDKESLNKLSSFIKPLDNVERVEILPYHSIGRYKWQALGLPYLLDDVRSPCEEEMAAALKIVDAASYTMWKHKS